MRFWRRFDGIASASTAKTRSIQRFRFLWVRQRPHPAPLSRAAVHGQERVRYDRGAAHPSLRPVHHQTFRDPKILQRVEAEPAGYLASCGPVA